MRRAPPVSCTWPRRCPRRHLVMVARQIVTKRRLLLMWMRTLLHSPVPSEVMWASRTCPLALALGVVSLTYRMALPDASGLRMGMSEEKSASTTFLYPTYSGGLEFLKAQPTFLGNLFRRSISRWSLRAAQAQKPWHSVFESRYGREQWRSRPRYRRCHLRQEMKSWMKWLTTKKGGLK